jgi:hypothetical protein
MSRSEEQYAHIARWLDGEDVVLSAEERAIADEIRRGERDLGAKLDVPLPPQALDRARRRLTRELTRSRRRIVRIGYLGGAVAAAAAVIIVCVTALWEGPARPRPDEKGIAQTVSYEELFREPSLGDVELDMLSSQIDELEAEVTFSFGRSTVDVSINALQHEIDEFWLDETWAS